MRSAVEVHADLRARGFTLRVCDGRLTVSPASRLTERDRGEIRALRDALIHAVDAVPAGCLAPLACGHGTGICGRISCLVEGERDRFAAAVEAARSPENPNRVPDAYVNDISDADKEIA